MMAARSVMEVFRQSGEPSINRRDQQGKLLEDSHRDAVEGSVVRFSLQQKLICGHACFRQIIG